MIRLLIVAAVRLYRDGIGAFLAGLEDVEVVGSFADCDAALAAALQNDPHIVLLEASASEAGSAVRDFEAVGTNTRVVALSIADDETDVLAWAEAGAVGYVTREDSLQNLAEIVHCVDRGEMPCSPRMAATLLRRVRVLAAAASPPAAEVRLTVRQREIVGLIERGLSNKEIARELCIEQTTVKNHVHNILEKLDVRRRGEAVERVHGRRPVRELASR